MTETVDYLAHLRQHIIDAVREAAHDCGEGCPLPDGECDESGILVTGRRADERGIVVIDDVCATPEGIAEAVIDKLFTNEKHLYFSTSCLHDDHRYCQQQTGNMGLKNPGECKFCNRNCLCLCHDRGPLC